MLGRNNTDFLPVAYVLGLQPGIPLEVPIVVVAEDSVTSLRYYLQITRGQPADNDNDTSDLAGMSNVPNGLCSESTSHKHRHSGCAACCVSGSSGWQQSHTISHCSAGLLSGQGAAPGSPQTALSGSTITSTGSAGSEGAPPPPLPMGMIEPGQRSLHPVIDAWQS